MISFLRALMQGLSISPHSWQQTYLQLLLRESTEADTRLVTVMNSVSGENFGHTCKEAVLIAEARTSAT